MTKDDILEMALEAGIRDSMEYPHMECDEQSLERFAALVAAAERKRLEATAWGASQKWIERAIEAEREACAKVAENGLIGHTIAKAIRARGNQ